MIYSVVLASIKWSIYFTDSFEGSYSFLKSYIFNLNVFHEKVHVIYH